MKYIALEKKMIIYCNNINLNLRKQRKKSNLSLRKEKKKNTKNESKMNNFENGKTMNKKLIL